MSTPTSIADFLNRLGPVAVAKLDAYPIKTNVQRSISGDAVNSALQDFANLLSNLLADKMDEMTVDAAPTAGSSNLVTSGGVAEAITAGIAAALSDYMTSAQVTQAIATALLPYAKTADVATEVAIQISAALAGYSTTAQMQEAIADALGDALANYSNTAQMNFAITNAINNALVSYSTTAEVGRMIANTLTNYPSIQDMNSAIASALTNYLSASQTYAAIANALTDYVTNTSLAATLASYYTKTEMNAALALKQDKLTFDDAPTEGSDNPVKSGGIYDAIAAAVVAVEAWVQGAFARIDGYYQTLTAGAAENLVGRGTTPAVISFRPAGGTQDIGSGAASIAKIKGRTDAWNQTTPQSIDGAAYALSNNQVQIKMETPPSFNSGTYRVASLKSGHKYFLAVTSPAPLVLLTYINGEQVIQAAGGSRIFAPASDRDLFLGFASGASLGTFAAFVEISDLTLQYGAGREPATAAAFLAEYPEALIAPYNAGKLIPNKVTALVTDGFNQWDEQWELGEYNSANGAKVASTSRIRSKNYIPCLPNTTYYIMLQDTTQSTKAAWVYFYGPGHKYISASQAIYHGTFTTPANCYYITFNTNSGYGTTYKNDIAINLSHSGIRNGEYEPHWASTLNLDHSKIYGKLNGEGEMVQIAPNGFRGVGGNYDEVDIVRKEAYIRRAQVDMGTLTYGYNSGSTYPYFSAQVPGMAVLSNGSPNTILSEKLAAIGAVTNISWFSTHDYNKMMCMIGAEDKIMLQDTAYTDPAAFKTAMSGVMLDFQLATPLHYTDLMYSEDGGQTFTEIPSNYRVDDFGTERRLPDGLVDGAPASTPLVADIRYSMNAVDTLRRLPTNYLSKESTENLLAALQSAGVIAGYTMTYDDTNAQYDFTITPNA